MDEETDRTLAQITIWCFVNSKLLLIPSPAAFSLNTGALNSDQSLVFRTWS